MTMPRFSQRGVVDNMQTHEPTEVWQIYNGTVLFVLTRNATLPGGYHCGFVEKQINPASAPFTWLLIDADATAGPDASISGFDNVQTWIHNRPAHGHFMAGNMTWFVLPGQSSAPPRLLRTSYLEFGLPHTPHQFDVSDGQRDFHLNFTLDIEPELAPPAGVTCVPRPPNAVEPSFLF